MAEQYAIDKLFDGSILDAATKATSYSVKDVAKKLKMGTNTILRYIKDGRIKAEMVSGAYVITKKDFEAFKKEEFKFVRGGKGDEGKITSIIPEKDYSMKEVQQILNRNYNSVWSYISYGSLIARKEDGRWKIKGQDIIDFMKNPDKQKRKPRTRVPSKKDYAQSYSKEHYDRTVVLLPKGMLAQIKEIASEKGTSVNDLFVSSLYENLGIPAPKKKYASYGVELETED